MPFLDQFDDFDPLSGAVPASPFISLPTIAERARKLLTSRSRDALVSAAQSIDYFIDEFFTREENEIASKLFHETGIDPRESYAELDEKGNYVFVYRRPTFLKNLPSDVPTPDNTSEVTALKGCIWQYDLESNTDFTSGREYEYFAVLALRLVADALLLGAENDDLPAAAAYTIDAMDAVCYGEHLYAKNAQTKELDNLRLQLQQMGAHIDVLADEKAKKARLTWSKEAAATRNEPFKKARQYAIQLYKQHATNPTMSVRKIAKTIWPEVGRYAKTLCKPMSDDRGEQTVREWIYNYKKQKNTAR